MRVVAFDTETALIRPALLAPPLVCLTWQESGGTPQIAHHRDAGWRLRKWLEDPDVLLVGHNVAYDLAVICEAFDPYDSNGLRRLVFKAYDADRVTDTMIRQQLLDIAAGRYPKGSRARNAFTLETLAKRCANIELSKDAWRLSYAEFIDTPLEQWPARALEVQAKARVELAHLERMRVAGADSKEIGEKIDGLRAMISSAPEQCLRYPLEDARATLAVFESQEKHAAYLDDQHRQARAAISLHLSSAWGLKTDPPGVELLERELRAELEECRAELIEAGFVRPNGVKNTKVAKALMVSVCRAQGLPLPHTDKHDKRKTPADKLCTDPECEVHISLDEESCEATEHPTLIRYAELTKIGTMLSKDIVALKKGVLYPIHTRYGLAETGRTTSSKPNIQNWARGRKCKACKGQGDVVGCTVCNGTGTLAGAREAFVPRAGYVFAQADFPQLELYTLAQCCVSWFGESALAKALNDGLDPHLAVGAVILGTTYDEAKKTIKDKAHPLNARTKEARGAAKPANFGWPGGLGVDSYVEYSKAGYGVVVSREKAREIKAHWGRTWPEMAKHFARVNALCANEANRATVETLFTKRTRGNATYCAACNNGFQALGSDCAKRAAWLLTKAMYVEPESPLYGCRMVAFIHDEFILEVPDDERAHDAAYELARLMVEGANAYLPDVPIALSKMEPLLMRRWSKRAEARFDAAKRLVPWAA